MSGWVISGTRTQVPSLSTEGLFQYGAKGQAYSFVCKNNQSAEILSNDPQHLFALIPNLCQAPY